MRRPITLRERFLMIGICLSLMTAGVYLWGSSMMQEKAGAANLGQAQGAPIKQDAPIRGEAGVFRGMNQASRLVGIDPESVRSIFAFRERRAYPGAPPYVPHAVEAEMHTDFGSCLDCHREGGYVKALATYAPVTPHPEMANCRQCHVQRLTEGSFRENGFTSTTPPLRGRAALPGGPPPMPHQLQMRENCSACHTGPAALREIRCRHPERVYCRQCHVPATEPGGFVRGEAGALGAASDPTAHAPAEATQGDGKGERP